MQNPAKLSKGALTEFKNIWEDEFDESITNAQAEDAAMRLLNVFSLLYSQTKTTELPKRQLSANERKALDFIKSQFVLRKKVSARRVAEAVGLKSSRSGLQILRRLKEHGGFPEAE